MRRESLVPWLLFAGLGSLHAGSAVAASSLEQDLRRLPEGSGTARVWVDSTAGKVTLQPEANALPDRGTLLSTGLGGDADITSPAIARGGGGTAQGVTYTSGAGGHQGEAAVIAGSGHAIRFPAPGNFNARQGTIDFWMSLPNWGLDASGHTSDHPSDQMVLYAADGDKSVRVVRRSEGGGILLEFRQGREGVYGRTLETRSFLKGSWHHFTFTWNIEEDIYYVAAWLDDAYQREIADPSPNTFDPACFASFHPPEIYVGNRNDGQEPLNGALDDLRITDTEYSTTPYPGKAGILTGGALDTGVPRPVWGEIKWDEALPPKTDIELQTSTSDDGSNWTSWFAVDEAMVTITFDDGYSSTYDTAYPIMKPLGFGGVAYVVTHWIGQPNRLTVAQLHRLQDMGWEIGSHGADHVSSRQSFADSKAWLSGHELGHSAFAYPGGVFDQGTIRDVSEHYATARTGINQYQTYAPKYQLYGYAGNSGPTDVSDWIDSVRTKKAWGILVFHSIGQPETPGAVSVADFTTIMHHLAASHVSVVTLANALARLGLYTDSAGDPIVSANQRYIRYRAILQSHDGIHTPTLSRVVLSAPARLYQGIDATIGADGIHDHAVWPQTTDTAIDAFAVTPEGGSVTVHVDTWRTSGTFYRKWTEAAIRPDVVVGHSMGNLVPGNHYRVKRGGNPGDVYLAGPSGQIGFKYAPGPSTVTFEVEQATSGPSIAGISSSASATGATLTWTTGERASSVVDYGPTPSYGTSTTETDASPGTTDHSVALSGLRECTTYHFRVRSKGSAADAAAGDDGTFTTSGHCTQPRVEASAPRPPEVPQGPRRIQQGIPWEVVVSCGAIAVGIALFVLSLGRRRSSRRRR